MSAPTSQPLREPRWPVALAILVVMGMFVGLPERVSLLPQWVGYTLAIAVLVPIVAVWLTKHGTGWMRAERGATLGFFVVSLAVTVANVRFLVNAMIYSETALSGLQLMTSGVAAWVGNILIFSLLYWQVDRNGPEARMARTATRPDWLFPQEGAPAHAVPPDWGPRFVDYLYLSYSTATAFSTTDVMPLTGRAKLLMMTESLIALVTVVVVAARAINLLGS